MISEDKLPKKGVKQQHWPLIKTMNHIINKYGIISLGVQSRHAPRQYGNTLLLNLRQEESLG